MGVALLALRCAVLVRGLAAAAGAAQGTVAVVVGAGVVIGRVRLARELVLDRRVAVQGQGSERRELGVGLGRGRSRGLSEHSRVLGCGGVALVVRVDGDGVRVVRVSRAVEPEVGFAAVDLRVVWMSV